MVLMNSQLLSEKAQMRQVRQRRRGCTKLTEEEHNLHSMNLKNKVGGEDGEEEGEMGRNNIEEEDGGSDGERKNPIMIH